MPLTDTDRKQYISISLHPQFVSVPLQLCMIDSSYTFSKNKNNKTQKLIQVFRFAGDDRTGWFVPDAILETTNMFRENELTLCYKLNCAYLDTRMDRWY